MRKTILAAGLTALAALSLAACSKPADQTNATAAADNTAPAMAADNSATNAAADNSASPTNSEPPGRGDPTRQ